MRAKRRSRCPYTQQDLAGHYDPEGLLYASDQPVGANYLREVGKRLIYCDHNCYAAHFKNAVLLLENQSRAS
jgi:hypothetical protein